VSTSSATGIVVAEIHVESEQSPDAGDTTTSRQPSATAAAARLPPEGPSLVPRMHSIAREKRYKTDAWFLLKVNRKSYALYRMVTLPMTLHAP